MSTGKKRVFRTEEEISVILAEAKKNGASETARKYKFNPSLISMWKKKRRKGENLSRHTRNYAREKKTPPSKSKPTYQVLAIPEKQNSKIALMITDDRDALIEILKGL